MLPNASFFEEQPMHGSIYLSLAQQPWPAAAAETYLEQMAETGFLLVPACADVVPHGDVLFRQQRKAVTPVGAGLYWRRRHGRMHEALCEQHLRHLPIRMAPDAKAPAALVWLVPAVREAQLTAPGFTKSVVWDEAMRLEWLLTWAKQLSEISGIPRLLVQLPGVGSPAYWYNQNYLGDEPVNGSCYERLRMLLAGLPRYPALPLIAGSYPATPALAEQDNWPLLVNESPTSWGAGQIRTREHGELLPLGGGWY